MLPLGRGLRYHATPRMRCTLLLPFVLAATLPAQQDPPGPVANLLLDTCDWRLIGPFRGGRVAAVTGVVGQRDVYWFGSCGGGVWNSTDGGKSWTCKSDGTFGGSIGAVAVAPSDGKIVYVGGGEETWRGNVSSGDGMWKSTDGGDHWQFAGLPQSRHISRIRVHPRDPNLVYAAVMGHVSGPSQERGVYRSKDGGNSWERVLFANELAGAVDLVLDAQDPAVLYASTWRAIRTPYSFESGGDGSALWKSTDGGDTWQDLSHNQGMPEGTLGIIGVAPSPANGKRVYAMVEAKEGGLFRSDDAGLTWTRINDDRKLRQRAWYYTRCYADPKDQDTVYVVNVGFHRSRDGGKTFEGVRTPHGDNHDLWIDPQDQNRMIEGNDGGACVTTDGGANWSSLDNQPTAQFYRVTTDDAAPYRIYGAQQDNSTVRIRSRTRGPAIGRSEWESTAGAESGWLAPKPGDAEIVYGGNYGGYLERRDHRLGLSRNVSVWPDNPMGAGAAELRYRFQWNFPILFSPHDQDLLYTAGNVLFATRNGGQTWQPISPDLTRNDKQKQQSSGGPITQDNTSVEYYCTIFTVAESPVQPGVIWCGSDDGMVHVSRDAGAHWADVTPPPLPEWAQINCIEAHPTLAGGCYLAATRYKLDDFRPYLYATEDFGKTWRSIVSGIDPQWFARCIRADPRQPGLLFAGTERGVWLSFNDGRLWQRLQRNLPITPITDLCVHGDDLIAATQGRSFWSFDHLAHLRALSPEMAMQPACLFTPEPFQLGVGGDKEVAGQGRNPASAPVVRFLLGGAEDAPITDAVSLTFRDWRGNVLQTLSTEVAAGPAAAAEQPAPGGDGGDDDPDAPRHQPAAAETAAKTGKLEVKRGMNTARFEPKFEGAKKVEGMILWAGGLGGPSLAPGTYQVTLKVGAQEFTQPLSIHKDPRTPATEAELQARFDFVVQCRDQLTAAHEAILKIRSLREQMQAVAGRADGDAGKRLDAERQRIAALLTEVEEALYQTKSKSSQDPLNFPIRLNDKLAGVMSMVNGAEFGPTDAQVAVKNELIAAIEVQLERYRKLLADELPKFNALALQLAVPYVK